MENKMPPPTNNATQAHMKIPSKINPIAMIDLSGSLAI